MKLLTTLCALLLAAGAAWGADLSKKSTDELLSMRGTMTTAQEREQLHNELQHRYETMTQEQKQRFNSRPENAPGRGMGGGQGMGIGGGGGGGMGMGKR